MKKIALFIVAFSVSFIINAQTAKEIIKTYHENIGGLEKLKKVEGVKMSATVNQGMEIPIEIYTFKDGKQLQ